MRKLHKALRTAAVLSGLILLASHSAHAENAAQYLTAFHKDPPDPALTLTKANADQQAADGHFLEITGKVCGVVSGTGSSINLLVSLPDGTQQTFSAPAREQDMAKSGMNTITMRFLLQAHANPNSNVPTFQLIAMAPNDDVTQLQQNRRDTQEAKKLDEQADEAQWKKAVQNSMPPDLRGTMPSRGGFTRGGSGVQGDVLEQEAYYLPLLPPASRNMFAPYFTFISGWNPKLDARSAGQIAYYLILYCVQNSVDPRLASAMIIAESDFDPNCTSHAGAMGLGQLMPDDLKELGLTNAYDIQQNLYGSIVELQSHLAHFSALGGPGGSISDQQITMAMAAYNAGYGAVKKYGGVPPYQETQRYVARILKLYHQFLGN